MGKALKITLFNLILATFAFPLFAEEVATLTPEQIQRRLKIAQQKLGPWADACFKRDELLSQKKYAEAADAGKEALKVAEQAFGSSSQNVASSLFFLGRINKEWGKYDDAENYLKRSIEMYRQIFGHNNPAVSLPLNELQEVYRLEGKAL